MSKVIGPWCLFAVALAMMLTVPAGVLAQSAATPGAEGQVTVQYIFDRPEVVEVTIAGQQYDRVV